MGFDGTYSTCSHKNIQKENGTCSEEQEQRFHQDVMSFELRCQGSFKRKYGEILSLVAGVFKYMLHSRK